MAPSSLVVIAGPNGSGKSSLIRKLMTIPELNFGTYINADDIELGLGHIKDPQLRSREAQRIADQQRETCKKNLMPFSFETVMSHPSKIDLMLQSKQLGYSVTLFFVAVDDPSLNIDRVNTRVSQGGHSVPTDRIVSRYYRTLSLLPRALLASDSAVLFDNTERGTGPTAVMTVSREAGGFQFDVLRKDCEWLDRELLAYLPFSGLRTGQIASVIVPEIVLREADHQRTAGLTFP